LKVKEVLSRRMFNRCDFWQSSDISHTLKELWES